MRMDEVRAAEGAFRAKIEVVGDHHIWTGRQDDYGGLRFLPSIDGKQRFWSATRFAYALASGVELPKCRKVVRTCEEPRCVRPGHLSLAVDVKAARAAEKAAAREAAQQRRAAAKRRRQRARERKRVSRAALRAPTIEGLPWTYTCRECEVEKARRDFRFRQLPSGTWHMDKTCLECRRLYHRRYQQTRSPLKAQEVDERFRRTLAAARRRARERGQPSDLTMNFLRDLWDAQEGRCALTGLPMILSDRSYRDHATPTAPSLDRIDSTRGYTRDNVRFVLLAVNLAMSSWGLDAVLPILDALVTRQATLAWQKEMAG